jgi:ATP-dependent Lon protease
MRLVETVVPRNRLVALVPSLRKDGETEKAEELFGWGCVARLVKVLRFPDDTLRVLVRGLRRARCLGLVQTEPYLKGRIEPVEPGRVTGEAFEALARTVLTQFQELITIAPNLPEDLRVALLNIDDPGRQADLIANTLSIRFEEKLAILEALAVPLRLERLSVLLTREIATLKLGNEIQDKVNSTFGKQQREAYLREQLRAIQEQLNEEPDTPELADLRKRLAQADLPPEAREAADRELERLRRMHPANADYQVARGYLEWLVALPWNRVSEERTDLREAARILDADHYGLEKAKERILEYLAVRQLQKEARGPILCFVGPPGVGKTSLGQSIARALGREFVRVSLGGIRDEAEIRGHRRTYVGALPGRLLQGIRRAKTANPVFMLDEIDKIGADFRGDPGAALLEALDPEQNGRFSDHYLEVPFNLSRVLFIATANLTDPILPALHDRMEMIRLPGYTAQEQREIARRFLVPRQMAATGLDARQLRFNAAALDAIIARYTHEAGVRNLEREIGTICRKVARRLVESRATGQEPPPLRLAPAGLPAWLGPQRLFPEHAATRGLVGVATGLAWTAAGGEILLIEATAFPGKGTLTLTGSLGDVMKESAQIALSFVRTHHAALGFDPALIEKQDLHLHVPAGATPKDGPSAGITMAVALASLLTGRAVRPRLAMTGELSLQGRVLPVGGVKEKLIAAARAGVRTVLMPEKNRNDLDELPADVRRLLRFEFCAEVGAVFATALLPAPARRHTNAPTPKEA